MSSPAAARLLARQGGLFALVGLAATGVHAATSLAARSLGGADPVVATLVGYVCSVGVSYLGNARFTFGRPALHGAQFARFLTISLIGLAANTAITWLLAKRLGWPFPAALAVVVVVIPTLSFVGAKLWAFAVPEGDPKGDLAEDQAGSSPS